MSQGFTKDYLVKATGDSEVTKFLTEQNPVTGTGTVTFTIPSGVKKFTLHMFRLGIDTTNDIRIRLGGDSGMKTSGYHSSATRFDATTLATSDKDVGFEIRRTSATDDMNGSAVFELIDPINHKWSISLNGADATGVAMFHSSGAVGLGEEVTTLQILPNGGAWNLTAAKANISYENPELAVSGIATTPAGVTDVFINGTKQASTSTAAIDFTVPSGIKKFTVNWANVACTATAFFGWRLGDSGGVKTAGYDGIYTWVGSAAQTSAANTDSFTIGNFGTVQNFSGIATFTLLDAATNTWCCVAQMMTTGGTDYTGWSTGHVVLSGELTTIRSMVSTGTFNAGSINIQYDNQELDLGSGVISGGVIQTVQSSDGETASTTTTVPFDDTIPQNTEGTEFLSASITPTDVANTLKIEVLLNCMNGTASRAGITSIFQDSTADALSTSVTPFGSAASENMPVTLTHWMDAGTTSSTTFKVRMGPNLAGTMYINGYSAGRQFGGKYISSITITEYKA